MTEKCSQRDWHPWLDRIHSATDTHRSRQGGTGCFVWPTLAKQRLVFPLRGPLRRGKVRVNLCGSVANDENLTEKCSQEDEPVWFLHYQLMNSEK